MGPRRVGEEGARGVGEVEAGGERGSGGVGKVAVAAEEGKRRNGGSVTRKTWLTADS